MKRPIVRVTNYRPPGAGSSPPLERQAARPGAAAWPDASTDPEGHQRAAMLYSDEMLDLLIADDQERTAAAAKSCARRGIRYKPDYQDHETRWLAHRISACRAERRRRKMERRAA